jgi:hypothetical protein
LALDHGDVGVVSELVEEGGDGGGVGEDGIPVAEREVRSEDDGLLLVTAIDDLVEQVGGMVVIVPFVRSRDSGVPRSRQRAAACLMTGSSSGRLTLPF